MGGSTCKCTTVENEIIHQSSQIEKRETNSQKSSNKQVQNVIDKAICSLDQIPASNTPIQARCMSPNRQNELSPINIHINKFDLDQEFEAEEQQINEISGPQKKNITNQIQQIKPQDNAKEVSNCKQDKQTKGQSNQSLFNKQADSNNQPSQQMQIITATSAFSPRITISPSEDVQLTVQEGQKLTQNQQTENNSQQIDDSIQICQLGEEKFKKSKINDKKMARSVSMRKNEDKDPIKDVMHADDEQSIYSKGTKKGILKQNSLYQKQLSMKKIKSNDNMSIGTVKSKKSVHFDEKSIKKKNRNPFF